MLRRLNVGGSSERQRCWLEGLTSGSVSASLPHGHTMIYCISSNKHGWNLLLPSVWTGDDIVLIRGRWQVVRMAQLPLMS